MVYWNYRMGVVIVRRQHSKRRNAYKQLQLINLSLNAIIQNQNELYLKMEELEQAVKESTSSRIQEQPKTPRA